MVRRRLLFFSMFSAYTFIALIFIAVAGCGPFRPVDQTNPPIDMGGNLVDPVGLDPNAASKGLYTPDPSPSSQPQMPDGQALFASYCAQCHVAPLIEKNNKTRAEWEEIIMQMEQMGVNLDDAEKAILLDFLD